MKRFAALPLACVVVSVLAACQAEQPVSPVTPVLTPPQPPAQTPAPPAHVVTRDDIVGEWRLVSMNGRAAADQPGDGEIPAAISLTVGPSTLRARSQCIGFLHRYTRPGQALALSNWGPVTMCARGLSRWEQEFGRTLAGSTEARVVDRQLVLTGAAGRLEFEPAPEPARVDLTGRWVLSSLHGQKPPPGAEPVTLEITRDEIRAQSGCIPMRWGYWQSSGNLELSRRDAGPVCERTRTAWEERVSQLIDATTIGVRVDDRTLVLDGGLNQAEFRRID